MNELEKIINNAWDNKENINQNSDVLIINAINQIIEDAKLSGVKTIKGQFIPTAKNKPAENFYENLGFKKEDEFWVFDTDNIMKKPEHIKVIKNE